ncbi:fibronectin type III domain-containing protein [Actinomycetota bacterium]
MSVPTTAVAWDSLRDFKCMVRANGYAAEPHPELPPAEVQERTAWLYAQCAENRAAEAIAEEHGSTAPELFPNTEDDRHAHPLHCMRLTDDKFGLSTGWRSWSEVDPELPGGAAAINIPGEFMYAWIDGQPRFFIRYVVWTINDRDGNPLSPVRINQHPTYEGTPQETVAVLHFSEAYEPISIWAEMPASLDLANKVKDRVLAGRSFAARTWMQSHCHDKRYKTNIPQMVIDHVKDLGWLNPSATAQDPRVIRFVADGDPTRARSWSLAEEAVTLPSQINTKNIYRWFDDAGVTYASGDVTRPTKPVAMTAEPRSATRIRLEWGAASDNVGVAGYQVYQNGAMIGYTEGLAYISRQLQPETEYTYKVYAVDEQGNRSPRSRFRKATTFADTKPPTRPKNVTVTATVDTIFMDWDPATDYVGISHYWVKSEGVVLGTPTDTSWVIEGLEPDTEYTVVVRAVDTSGNRSLRVLRTITTLSG